MQVTRLAGLTGTSLTFASVQLHEYAWFTLAHKGSDFEVAVTGNQGRASSEE